MESVHGVDVSWMHRTTSNTFKDQTSNATHAHASPAHEAAPLNKVVSGGSTRDSPSSPKTTSPRPPFSRSTSAEKTATVNGGSKSPSPGPTSRRNSWLSSISSKFSPTSHTSGPTSSTTPPSPSAETANSTGSNPSRPAVLPHGAKAAGDVPYTPAPPKSTQPGFLQSAFRRLSSSGGQLANGLKSGQHGMCERRILNVDPNRERCHLSELDQSKLRRVAFCVDVEIASGPRYNDECGEEDKEKTSKKEKKKQGEKGEGQALKNSEDSKSDKGESNALDGSLVVDQEPTKEASGSTIPAKDDHPIEEKDTTRKKEKKKRSEEERKARKEKKRRLAEANGTVPVEMVRNELNGSESSLHSPGGSGNKGSQLSPTIDPLRIYRRCCQLRETPILKKITEQLAASSSPTGTAGVTKLDLTDYWMQLPDLVTLGDYLAVVPVKELIMENCGLTDEGIRVILAGLLAAKPPVNAGIDVKSGGRNHFLQGGVIERLVFTNNTKIGRDGWRYLCLFINMCRSLKSLDLSKVPFPQPLQPAQPASHSHLHFGAGHQGRTTNGTNHSNCEISHLLSMAIGERLAGKEFELLNVAECGLSTDQLGDLLNGIIKSGLRRLGLAGNNITPEGMHHVSKFIQSGSCEGLDLGGNDLKDLLSVIADAVNEDSPLIALSLRDCNLTPDSIWQLFPALVKLKNFRFIDLSQNHELFERDPSAISLLRRYLPKMPILKRIHLTDVSMTPEQAIALAEILPDTPSLAHVNLLENPKLFALANAKDEANQEEACALYASLMAAVRVSETIVCIDIEVPSNDSSEVVKALAKQVVAYCLYNMERGPVAEISETSLSPMENNGVKEVTVPDVLLHLVGHNKEGSYEQEENVEPAPDDDYVIGGTGVVKALGICLRNRGNDSRRPSADRAISSDTIASGVPNVAAGGKAKQMSKNLLGSARNIRARLQPALLKESRGDQVQYARLLFLDQTLTGMIKRFEDEFPETRLPSTDSAPQPLDTEKEQTSPIGSVDAADAQGSDTEELVLVDTAQSDDEYGNVRPVLSRHNSDVSLASKAFTEEEGRMLRYGSKLRRDLLKREGDKHEDSGTEDEELTPSLQLLRALVDGTGGEELRRRLEDQGQDAVLEELNDEASSLRLQLIQQDPESWKRFADTMEVTHRNTQAAGMDSSSAIE